MIDLLILLLAPALRFRENPRKYWYFFWALVPAYLLDVLVAHTSFALVAGWPHPGEYTVSQMLYRLCREPDGDLYRQIGLKINKVSGLNHIDV